MKPPLKFLPGLALSVFLNYLVSKQASKSYLIISIALSPLVWITFPFLLTITKVCNKSRELLICADVYLCMTVCPKANATRNPLDFTTYIFPQVWNIPYARHYKLFTPFFTAVYIQERLWATFEGGFFMFSWATLKSCIE